MTDFFKFTKVQAPDLSASASLMRGAQQSVTAATNALSRASDRVNLANQATDTRIRTDNTNQLINQINQATTLAEVDELQKYVGSDAFTQEYESGFYIDSAKINDALASRPKNIEGEYKIKQDIQSRDEGTAVGGYVSGIGSASSKEELDALRDSYTSRNYTAAGMGKLNTAYSARLGEIENKKNRDLQNQVSRQNLKQTQDRQAYETDIVKMTSIARSKLAVTDNITPVNLEQQADDVARQIVEKYKGTITYDEAKVKAQNQLTSWYNSFNTAAQIKSIRGLSEDQRQTYLTNQAIMLSVDSTAKANTEISTAVTENFPIVSRAITEEPVTPAEFTSLRDSMEADSSPLADLDPRLRTSSILTGLTSIEKTGNLKLRVAQLNENLNAHTIMKTGMERSVTQAANIHKRKGGRIQMEVDENVKKTATVTARLEAAQKAGDLPKVAQYQNELSALTNDFMSLEKRQADFVNSPTDAARIWRDSPEGIDNINKYLVKTASNRSLGTMNDRLAYSLEFISTTYGLPEGTQWDMPTLTKEYGVPEAVAKKAVSASDKLDKDAAQAEKSKRIKESTAKQRARTTYMSDY